MDQTINPRVTVLMPVFNSAPYLREAIGSILSQSFKDFELLIINDGSTDESEELIQSFDDPRIRYVTNGQNLGLIKTLNKGIQLAQGEFIARMDADDISYENRLEKQVFFLDHNPTVSVVATRLILVNETGEETGVWPEDYATISSIQINNMLPKINCVGHPTVMMRKSIVKNYGYNEKYEKSEDWGLWLTLLADGHVIAKLEDTLLKYRIRSTSITAIANAESVWKKIIRFKLNYLKEKVSNGKLRGIDYQVVTSLIKDLARYLFPKIYTLFILVYTTRYLELLKQFRLVNQHLNSNKAISHIFFFPFYNTGGAERVHAEILATVAGKNPLALITGISNGDALLNDFKKSATVIDVAQLLIWPFTKKWLMGKVAAAYHNNNDVVLFGCNSKFYYEALSEIPEHIKAIDLLHAFSHKYEDGAEKWSLPVVHKLTARVVISQKTKHDFSNQYKLNNIPDHLLDRVNCITNFVEEKSFIEKENTDKLNITYIGRDTAEKRVHLIARAARVVAEKKLGAEFHFIGNIGNVIFAEDLPYCILHGEIRDIEKLNSIYKKAHILVMASSREGFPMVIMEAMMNAVVPVSTNVGGISEHVINNVNGVLFYSDDSDEIVNQIVKTIEYFVHHRNELNKMSVKAYDYARAHFDKSVFIKAYQRVLGN